MIEGLEPTEVVLHLEPDASLPARFGRRIQAAEGRYSHARTGGPRFVSLPLAGNDALVDDLVRAYPTRGGTLMVANRFEAPGHESARINAAFRSANPQVRFVASSGMAPSAALRAAVDRENRAFDWAPHRERWEEDRARDAAQRDREAAEAAMHAVAEAALALLDGHGDVGAVLDAARALRAARAAGEDEPDAAPGPAPR